MATDKQIQANRENSQHSTGPVSEAGREAVSQNRTAHGLAGAYKAQTESELEEFRRLTDSFINDYNAVCQTEIQLIFKMAEALIRSTRAMHYQDACMMSIESDDPDEAARARKEFELYIRYQAHHDRAYQRYTAELRKFQSENKKAEIGFESQKLKAADETRKQEHHEVTMSIAKARLEHETLKNRKLNAYVSSPQTQGQPADSASFC